MAKRTERVVLLLTADERATVTETAMSHGATVGGFVRKAALDEVERVANREREVNRARELLREKGLHTLAAQF